MSEAEQALWHHLRGRQFRGLKFRRQHPFGDYILDFVCLENKLVIEVDGGQHGQQAGYDENRTQILQAAGFRVLRFWDNEVVKEIESVKEKIWLVGQEVQPHPPPNLPLEEAVSQYEKAAFWKRGEAVGWKRFRAATFKRLNSRVPTL